MSSNWMENGEIIKIRANFDKSTKTTWRFIIEDNEFNISGALYVKKPEADSKDKDAPKTLIIKTKVKGV